MKTPAQIRRESVMAQKAASAEPKAQTQHANAYELTLAKLDSDRRALGSVVNRFLPKLRYT
ncbi:MAG: hypothetical protein FWG81_02305 [Betaproteobacteria bacterium]|nr:hypothetical protein [Betaproteobacteria bacterium]